MPYPIPSRVQSAIHRAWQACARASRLGLAACLVASAVVGTAHADPATLASWNIRHLGHGELKRYDLLGAIVQRASLDFLAVQEAMTADGIEALEGAIEDATDAPWQAMYSHDLGRGSHKEKYAFLWNAAEIDYVDGAAVYLDVTDRFAREPYSARFRVRGSGLTFVAATVHILHGERVGDRAEEVRAIAEYWRWLRDVYTEDAERLLLMGDFNLAPHHAAWAPLRAEAVPLIEHGATTLSTIDGRFANLYDNIWVAAEHRLPIVSAGIFRFPAHLGLTHEDARRHVSDHAPVWVVLDTAATQSPTPGPVTRHF